MLSMHKISSAGYAHYLASVFTGLAHARYLTEPGEPPGYPIGGGARALGLFATITCRILLGLLSGFAPDGAPLRQNQRVYNDSRYRGGREIQPGWDCVFLAGKEVSLLLAFGNEEQQASIRAAHAKAVRAGFGVLERAARCRRGPGGRRLEPVKLVGTVWEHCQARATPGSAPSPLLHSHLVLANAGLRADGTWGTIESWPLFKAKLRAGAAYRSTMALELRRLGIPLEKSRFGYRVASIPLWVARAFSQRRQAIEEELKRSGHSGPKASAVAAKRTRGPKQTLPRHEVFRRSKEKARDLGFDIREAWGKRVEHTVDDALGSVNSKKVVALSVSRAGAKRLTAQVEDSPLSEFAARLGLGPHGLDALRHHGRMLVRAARRRKTWAFEVERPDPTTLATFLRRSGLSSPGVTGAEVGKSLTHHVRMLARAARKKPTWTRRRSSGLDSRSAVVLAEAHLASAPELQALIRATRRARAKLVLHGETWRGSAFEELARTASSPKHVRSIPTQEFTP